MMGVMSLVTLAISVILATLIGIQQMMPSFTYGLINLEGIMPAWRGVVFVTISIWIGGLLIWLLLWQIGKMVSKKINVLEEIMTNQRVVDLMMFGVFLSLGMFLFILEKVPLFATPYPLLAYGVTILMIGSFNLVVGLMIYGSLEFYKKWIDKIKFTDVVAKSLAGLLVVFWLVMLVPVVVARMGLRTRNSDLKNVVLITSDTLRGDRFSPEYMPETYQWFEDKGIIFKQAYSTSPWTTPSFASMMTGRYPAELGADQNVAWVRENLIILPEIETMAEKFQDKDYYTAAILTNTWLQEERGFDQGFDYFENIEIPDVYHWGMTVKDSGWHKVIEELGIKKVTRLGFEYFVGTTSEENDFRANADMVSREAIWKLKELPEPFFMWVHYVDPHAPYEPPQEMGPDLSKLSEKLRFSVVRGDLVPEQKHLRPTVVELYDGEVRYHDKEIAKILRFLDKRGLSKKTAVVFTADHGEQLYENDVIGHGLSLRREEINVPLGVYPKFPVEQEVVDNEEVSLHLLGDWLLKMGENKAEEWLAEEIDRSVFAEGLNRGNEKKGIVEGGWKLVWEDNKDTNTWVRSENDEEVMLPYYYPTQAKDMQSKLESWRESNLEDKENYSKKLERQDLMLEGAAGY